MSGILLINPPAIKLYKGFNNATPKLPPLGLAYLAAYMEQRQIPVSIYDSFAEDASFSDIEKRIIESKEPFIGISSITSTMHEAITIAALSKRHGKKVVIGGPHVSAIPVETLEQFKCFDFGVVGEGEESLYQLVAGKNPSEIDALVYRDGDKVIFTKHKNFIEDISTLPHPARHLLNNDLYKGSSWFFNQNKGRFFNLITARGCSFDCTFCASKTIWGRNARFRSLEDVFSELDELKKMGMRQLWINDDTFTLRKERVKEIAAKIKSLDIEWGCNARVDEINRETMTYLKESNCSIVLFGIESGNQQILDSMKKNITLQQAETALKLSRELKLRTCCSFIIGNIGDTEKTVKETIKFAKKLNPDLALFNMLTPYPGTEAYRKAIEKDFLKKDLALYENPKFFEPVMSQLSMPSAKTKKLLGYAYWSFYSSPRFLYKFTHDSVSSLEGLKRNAQLLQMAYSILLRYLNLSAYLKY